MKVDDAVMIIRARIEGLEAETSELRVKMAEMKRNNLAYIRKNSSKMYTLQQAWREFNSAHLNLDELNQDQIDAFDKLAEVLAPEDTEVPPETAKVKLYPGLSIALRSCRQCFTVTKNQDGFCCLSCEREYNQQLGGKDESEA